MKPDRPQWIRRYRRSLNLTFSPSETFDGRGSIFRQVLSPHCAVASFRGSKDLAARRRGASESMIWNSAAKFPKFWVTERREVAKLKNPKPRITSKILLALGG